MFKKKQLPQLDEQSAAAILENVFLACEMTPSAVPLEVLSSYTQYRRDRFTLQKGVLLVILLVFLLLPLCFVAPQFSVEQISLSSTGVPTYELRTFGRIPVQVVSARNGRRSIPVYEHNYSVYTFAPTDNGWLNVNVTLLNRQYKVWSVYVSTIDNRAPQFLRTEYVKGKFRIYLEDEGVGTDFANASAYRGEEALEGPFPYNEEEGYMDLPSGESLTVFVPDYYGNTLQLDITMRSDKG